MPGPTKPPIGVFTTHKGRSAWYSQRMSYPFRDADPTHLEKRMAVHPEAGPKWECVGPFNIGGRVTSLAVHPQSGMLFAGAAAGGVWRSPDQGKTWLEPPARL